MNRILFQIRTLLIRDMRCMKREVEACPDDEVLWAVPPGITNPIGTLALHVCGNLQHYVGHVLGGNGYVRDRDREFAERSGTRESISQEIDATIVMLETIIPGIKPEVLDRPYPEKLGGLTLNTQQFLLHLCVHLGLHLGQAGYLRRIITGSQTSLGPVLLRELDA